VLATYPEFTDENRIESELRATAERLALKNQQFFGALRVAVTGKTVSLPLTGSMRVLGPKSTLRRIDRAIQLLEDMPTA
jgi:glutamyl-tRNA synthetase